MQWSLVFLPVNTTIMQHFSSIVFGFLLTLAIPDSRAQSRVISGVVTSRDESRALEGVAVSVKGTTKTSGTQADGIYYIRVETTDSVLVFTLPGYETGELKLAGGNEYNIALRPAQKEHYLLAASCRRCSSR